MPRPILKKINFLKVIKKSIEFIKISSKNSINVICHSKNLSINGDEDQLNEYLLI